MMGDKQDYNRSSKQYSELTRLSMALFEHLAAPDFVHDMTEMICERKGWAQEALAYNKLVVAWPRVKEQAKKSSERGQATLF